MKKIIQTLFCFSLCISLSLFGQVPYQKILRIAQELTNFPDNDTIHIESIYGGMTNENYKVIVGSKSYFFRFNNSASDVLGCSLEREWQISSLISKFLISPWVIYYAPEEGVLITEFIETTKKVNLHDPETLKRTCLQLNSLHAIYYRFTFEYDPYENIDNFVDKAHELGILLPEVFFEKILPTILTIKNIPTIPIKKTPSHLDLHAENILDDGEKLWLIDWEYAAMADPFFDLATLASVENFSDSEMNEFLTYYLKRSPTQEEFDHFFRMRILADTRWALWCYIQNKISPLDAPFELSGNEYINTILERI